MTRYRINTFLVVFGISMAFVAWAAGLALIPAWIVDAAGEPWGMVFAGLYVLAYLSASLAAVIIRRD